MRVSLDKHDIGYREDAADWRVRFNGVMTTTVVTADDVKGYVVRYQTDADGKLVLDDHNKPRLERVNGTVELIAP